ncbi:Cdp-alcohol phosphatidyltransferase, partial [Globisporangium splendens]
MAPSASPAAAPSSGGLGRRRSSYKYLTDDGAKNILNYKYSGSDASLIYNYIISPLAQKLVDHVIPPNLAPNAITISGLALVIAAHVCMLWFAPNMEEEAPRWVYATAGVSLILYQILDVADGKQARKTGNSSPLGLLFDHGCDALNVVISACTFAATIQSGATYWSLLLMLAPAMVFFMATWEEYYTGTLALPPVNGPNEGLAIMYSLYIATAIFGPAFWTQPNALYPALNNNHVFVLITFVAAIGQCFLSAVVAIRSLERAARDGAAAILGLTPFLALIGLSGLWVLWSPSDIFTDHPRLIMWTVGLLFAKMVMHMMLSHMCEEPYWLLRKTFVIQLAVSFLLVVGVVPWGHETQVVELFFILTLGAYLHMVYYVVTELATILNIHVFRVKQS